MVDLDTFKKTLTKTVDLLSKVRKQDSTSIVDVVAEALRVNSRQIWRWMDEDNHSKPHDLEGKYKLLLGLADQPAHIAPEPSPTLPAPKNNPAVFPFQVTIAKETLRFSQDKDGSIKIEGLLTVSLK